MLRNWSVWSAYIEETYYNFIREIGPQRNVLSFSIKIKIPSNRPVTKSFHLDRFLLASYDRFSTTPTFGGVVQGDWSWRRSVAAQSPYLRTSAVGQRYRSA